MSYLALGLLAALTAIVVVAIYPGELSWISRSGNRWLYERGAKNYAQKWRRHDYRPYDELILSSIRSLAHNASTEKPDRKIRVLDLGCGHGRATLLAAQQLGNAGLYRAVDYSAAMLAPLRSHIHQDPALAFLNIEIMEANISEYMSAKGNAYDLVIMMEVGEFLPRFSQVLKQIGQHSAEGTTLVLTRPAGLWHFFFLGRKQSRSALTAALESTGFHHVTFKPWRTRYELVHCVYGKYTAPGASAARP